MSRSALLSLGAVAAFGLAAACSSPTTLDGYDGTGAGGPAASPGVSASPGPGAGATTAGAQSTTNPGTGAAQPVPATGPGSLASPARQNFIDKVFPAIGSCVTCHATGNLGAPKFLGADAASSYAGLDGRGLIVTNSLFATKGSHAGGGAPALDASQLALINQWLAMEAQERVGQAAPVNILEKMGGCLDQALFDAIQFGQLRTQQRENENGNNCTGCNNAPCRTCHLGGDGNFYMAVGSALDTNTFIETKKTKFIVKYLGLNGTTPIASNAITLKGKATATDRPYSHPMYTINTEMQQRIDAFVNAAITKYQNKLCGQ